MLQDNQPQLLRISAKTTLIQSARYDECRNTLYKCQNVINAGGGLSSEEFKIKFKFRCNQISTQENLVENDSRLMTFWSKKQQTCNLIKVYPLTWSGLNLVSFSGCNVLQTERCVVGLTWLYGILNKDTEPQKKKKKKICAPLSPKTLTDVVRNASSSLIAFLSLFLPSFVTSKPTENVSKLNKKQQRQNEHQKKK